MPSGAEQGLFPEYGDDACNAATVSRQLPRIDKLVDVYGSLARTGVRLPPPPKCNYIQYIKLRNKKRVRDSRLIANPCLIKNRYY